MRLKTSTWKKVAGNIDPTKLVKLLSAVYKLKLVY